MGFAFKRTRVRIVAVGLTVMTALAAFSGTAFAHECYIASRSDTGNVAAGTNSSAWFYLGTLHDVFQLLSDNAGEFGLAPLTGPQIDQATLAGLAEGLPAEVTIFGPRTLLAGTPAEALHAEDNYGVDHIFPRILEIYMAAGA